MLDNEYNFDIPKEVLEVTEKIKRAGFGAYLVGGCVRDLLLHKKPKDWDVATNATPDEIQALFKKTVYENKFGTVAIVNEDVSDETLKIIEITPYRKDEKYSDKRHPDSVSFAGSIEEDLKRRDFTINALALDVSGETGFKIIDPFCGRADIKGKVVKAVGNPDERFSEDALRTVRAVRIATELNFKISHETGESIKNNIKLLDFISKERVREEFTKIIMSDNPSNGMRMMNEFGVLKYVAHETEEGIGVRQNKAHIYPVWDHLLKAIDYAAYKKWPFHVRLAALLHDVAKPQTRRWSKEKKDWTFYGHDVVGAKMAEKMLSKLKFLKRTIDIVRKLVRYHMFFSDTEKITLSAVRRIVRNVGPENVWDLMKVRFCDRIGMGKPKESPYRLRKYEAMIEEAMRDPITVRMLKIDGNRITELLHVEPGPVIGQVLHVLLEEVLDDPKKNSAEWLEARVKELGKLPEEELKKVGERAKKTKESLEEDEVKKIYKKWW